MIALPVPCSLTPMNTKPMPGSCENGLEKLEIARSPNSSAKIVRAAPRDFPAIENPSPGFEQLRHILVGARQERIRSCIRISTIDRMRMDVFHGITLPLN